jgi:hypothetical protein
METKFELMTFNSNMLNRHLSKKLKLIKSREFNNF